MNKEVLDKMTESLVAIGEILTTPGASHVDVLDEKLVKEAMHSPQKARDPHVNQTLDKFLKIWYIVSTK